MFSHALPFVVMLLFACFALCFFGLPDSLVADEMSDDPALKKSLSPYFIVISGEEEDEKLPLLSTGAEVNIAGVIADVKVTQVYKNEGKNPIEAIYVFPGSIFSAVYAMKMTIGERTIIAEIKEREEARAEYEEAKKQGKSASLLEQQRPNVFQMNVSNIMPGDKITVELCYTELLVPENGIYEFAYPAVVGPRYSNKPEEGAKDTDKWVANPFLPEGSEIPYTFDMKVNISTGIPLQEVFCPTHQTTVNYDGATFGKVELFDIERKEGGNRDFILKYKLQGGKIETGLLLYEGKDENFFLMMMEPPSKIEEKNIPPREYIFVLDVSGSMRGFPLEVSKEVLTDLIQNLRKTDMFNILLFSGGSELYSEKSVEATKENVDKALSFIDRQGGGGTELLPALERVLKLPRLNDNLSRSIVVVTDGYVDVEKECYDLIRNNLNRANLFSFGIGSSVNRYIIEGMARAGAGEPFIVTNAKEAKEKTKLLREYIEKPLLTQIEVNFTGFSAYEEEPQFFTRCPR